MLDNNTHMVSVSVVEGRANRFVRPCVFCSKKNKHRISIQTTVGKMSFCGNTYDLTDGFKRDFSCFRRVFPSFNLLEDEILFVKKFRPRRDFGLECEHCKTLMQDGVITLKKPSSIRLNKYKAGCCEGCFRKLVNDGEIKIIQ